MHQPTLTPLTNGTAYHFPDLTRAAFVAALRDAASFRQSYNRLLAEAPYPAFYWEHPVLEATRLDEPYEFSLLPSRSLALATADRYSFADYFTGTQPAVTFANLRGDAQLVVPDGAYSTVDFPSLAAVVRSNNPVLIDHFWQIVGEQLNRLLAERPVYLNTAGNGVYWCHVRLDSRPKYYKRSDYRYG
ncbi:MAG: hypothetical protein AAFZ52_09695 [Bacteroidota bacterium]